MMRDSPADALTEIERDAGRYRWLRRHFFRLVYHTSQVDYGTTQLDEIRFMERDDCPRSDYRSIDAAIDKAMRCSPDD